HRRTRGELTTIVECRVIELEAADRRAPGIGLERGLEPEPPGVLERAAIAELAIIERARPPLELEEAAPHLLGRPRCVPLVAGRAAQAVEGAAIEQLDAAPALDERTEWLG